MMMMCMPPSRRAPHWQPEQQQCTVCIILRDAKKFIPLAIILMALVGVPTSQSHSESSSPRGSQRSSSLLHHHRQCAWSLRGGSAVDLVHNKQNDSNQDNAVSFNASDPQQQNLMEPPLLEANEGSELDNIAQVDVEGESNAENDMVDSFTEEAANQNSPTTTARQTTTPRRSTKRRRTSDMVQSLFERSFDSPNVNQQVESNELRQLMTERADEYVRSLYNQEQHQQQQHQPHPKKLLHYMAPKIPAILYSPNIMLRIQSAARSDMDAGVAACLLATLARLCELYDRQSVKSRQQQRETNDIGAAPPFHSSSSDIINERQFEQLVECVLCGLNIKRLLLRDSLMQPKESSQSQLQDSQDSQESMEAMLEQGERGDSSNKIIADGLSLRDACRAAWGVAILGGHHYDTIGGETVANIFVALSLRVRELLLARVDRLCQEEDPMANKVEEHEQTSSDGVVPVMSDNRFDQMAEEIAEDAATAMWAFACVRACTGIRTVKLFETCCFILCQNPLELRRRVQHHHHHGDTSHQQLDLGYHDVVDRLALSDNNAPTESHTSDLEKKKDHENVDALLDWLSPNEITDMLWALALHGSSESYLSTKEDIVLSETATAVREIAFDRLLYWLKQDLEAVRDATREENGEQDREAIGEPINAVVASVVEEVAAQEALGAASDLEAPSEVVETSTAAASLPLNELETPTLSLKNPEPERIVLTNHRYFSLHDLCSILWAVTELRDSLRFSVVEVITEIFALQGQASTDHLEGGDLTNLAWAVAKHVSEQDLELPMASAVLLVTTLVAQSALQRTHAISEKHEHESVLHAFQPPELGRIMWSVATTFAASSESTNEQRKVVGRLCYEALVTAGSRLSMFATEDLARMAWAFLDICDFDDYLSKPGVLDALGKILVTIESSVLRWETGYCSSTDSESPKKIKINESILFATFFGKSRASTQLWDQRIGEVKEEEDDGLDDGRVQALLEKSGLPLLRDLSIDPSTLCRVANGYTKLSSSRSFLKGGWTLTRIAVRVLASENGQLMKECSFHDIVRVIEAVAAGEVSDRHSEFISRLFARRVVRILNDELHQRSESASPANSALSKLSFTEKCVLVDSLGKLGVRFGMSDNDKRLAYKKLRVVTDIPFFSPAQLSDIPVSFTTRLVSPLASKSVELDAFLTSWVTIARHQQLNGLILMDIVSFDTNFLLVVLKDLEGKVQELRNNGDVCSLVESLGKIGQILGVSDLTPPSPSSAQEEEEDSKDSNKDQEPSMNADSSLTSKEEIRNDLRSTCRRLLSAVASQTRLIIPQMSAEDLKRIVTVYTLLPVQEDDLFARIEESIAKRKRRWINYSTADLKSTVDEAVLLAQSFLSAKRNQAGGSSKSKKNFFQSMLFKETSMNEDTIPSLSAPQMELDPEAVREILNVLLRTTKDMDVEDSSDQSQIHAVCEGSYYELCCCEELVATYRRIEFKTGTHKSRYDKHHSRDIAKRVLSRLLPSPGHFQV